MSTVVIPYGCGCYHHCDGQNDCECWCHYHTSDCNCNDCHANSVRSHRYCKYYCLDCYEFADNVSFPSHWFDELD